MILKVTLDFKNKGAIECGDKGVAGMKVGNERWWKVFELSQIYVGPGSYLVFFKN